MSARLCDRMWALINSPTPGRMVKQNSTLQNGSVTIMKSWKKDSSMGLQHMTKRILTPSSERKTRLLMGMRNT